MRKKQYRENRNRLNRLGTLRLEKITDVQIFQSVFDELAIQYDFRQGAIHNYTPFKRNPLKKEFYVNLFKKGLMYVTVLWLDDDIIASVVGTVGEKGYIHGVGINSQSPYYGKYSPGFLNFILFAEQIEADGYQFMDLSTGGQLYKNRLANTVDTVIGLYISFSANKRMVRKTKSRLHNILNKGLVSLDINPEHIKAPYIKRRRLLKEKFAIIKIYGIFPWMKNKLLWTINNKSYIEEIGKDLYIMSQKEFCTVKRNSIKDLLDFEPDGTLLTRREFLYDSMKRIEVGEIPYTWTMNGKLLACIWVSADDIDKFTINNNICQNKGILLRGLYLYNKGSKNASIFLPSVDTSIFRSKFRYDTY